MPDTIELQKIPNQKVSAILDGDSYDIQLRTIGKSTFATITRNQEVIVNEVNCVAGSPIIPYTYLEKGNFIFITENDDLPFYEKFSDSQTLLYFSSLSLESIRG